MTKILVVDDIPDNVKLLAYELSDAGYEPLVAFSGAQALELAEEARPDCILLDVMMPGMDGYETCRRFKADDRMRNVPILMVSAKDAVEDVVNGLECGADDYITKPFNFRIVLARIQACLRVKRACDIVEQMNRRLELACREAEEANAAKSLFLANVSHEIRTPMSAILGFADLLESSLEGEDREPARAIHRNGRYLLELIDDILDHSKIEAGQLDVECVACDPRAIAAEVVDLMRGRIKTKRNVIVSARVDGPFPPRIVTDPTRLRQILINLLGNAVKFTDEGAVTLRMSMMGRSDGRRVVRFDVIDTGIGLTADQLARVCRPFAQADASTTRKYGGTGLGLSISKKLAGLLGGDLAISSVAGQGTRVMFTLDTGLPEGVDFDAREPAVSELPAVAADANLPLPRLAGRVLLAEDGPDNQRLFQFILTKAGAELTIADNGRMAVELVEQSLAENRPFDMVLMDMQMPELDGYAASRRLRELGYDKPIVALTAYAMSSDRRKCIASGCDDYLSKPIPRRDLVTTVARYLSGALVPESALS